MVPRQSGQVRSVKRGCSSVASAEVGIAIARAPAHEPVEESTHFGKRDDVIRLNLTQRAQGHGGESSFLGILHDGGAAATLDIPQSGYPVV